MSVYQKCVFVLPAHRHRFGYIGSKSVNRNFIGSNCVMAIFEDSDGKLWVGTDNDGLYQLDAGLTASKHYSGSGVPSTIMTVFEDSKQHMWVGSYLNGLARFDRKTESFTYPVRLPDKNGANVASVFHLAEDARKQDRMSVVTGQGVSVRVDLSG